ncbi:MAG: hypothetical protein JXB18_04340 [Sedimentisphaerales bacterium]|nr:hypothetical protein [Sedimentisphaerales bacterium]
MLSVNKKIVNRKRIAGESFPLALPGRQKRHSPAEAAGFLLANPLHITILQSFVNRHNTTGFELSGKNYAMD